MADKLCNEACGCAVPCAGADSCRCRISGGVGGVGGGRIREGAAHSLCSCGEHCSCNPCTCGRTEARLAVGRAACTCGPGCTCAACGSAS